MMSLNVSFCSTWMNYLFVCFSVCAAVGHAQMLEDTSDKVCYCLVLFVQFVFHVLLDQVYFDTNCYSKCAE